MGIPKTGQMDPITWVIEAYWPGSGIVLGAIVVCLFIFGNGSNGGGDGGDGGGC